MKKFKSNPSKTNLTICIGLTVFYFVFENVVLLYAVLIIGSMGLLSNKINLTIEKFWFLLAKLLGYIIPNIILSIVFYFVLTPLAFFNTFFNKRKYINLKPKKSSQFIKVDKKFNASSFENPW